MEGTTERRYTTTMIEGVEDGERVQVQGLLELGPHTRKNYAKKKSCRDEPRK